MTPQPPRHRHDRRRMQRAGQLRSPRRHGLFCPPALVLATALVTVRLGCFAGLTVASRPPSKMRIELAREHADHPLLRRVSAHLDVECQMMSELICSAYMKRLAQYIINIHAHIVVHMGRQPVLVTFGQLS